MLDSEKFTAWHAGYTTQIKYANPFAIGVEVHYSPGEGEWTGYMWEAITGIARMHPGLELVTHRGVAYPPGRKKDPSGVTDEAFKYWAMNYPAPYTLFKTTARTNVRLLPSRTSQIVTVLENNFCVFGFNHSVVTGESIDGNNKWRYLVGLGYVHTSLLVTQ